MLAVFFALVTGLLIGGITAYVALCWMAGKIIGETVKQVQAQVDRKKAEGSILRSLSATNDRL